MVFSDVFSTRFPALKVPPPRDSRGNEHTDGKRTPDAMKETRRDHGSARVSASAASAAVSRSAENSYAAPTRTSQPGDVAEEGRAEAERGGHGADVLIARADPTTTIDPSSSQIVAPLPASIAATLTEHKPGVYAYGNDEMGYFYIPAEDVPVARAYVESGGTGSARSSLTNSPMNPRAALGFSPFVPPTPRDSPGLTSGHRYQPSPAAPNGAGANVNYAPSLAHGGSFLQYAATAMGTKGKAGSSAAPVVDVVRHVSDNAVSDNAAASREYELALRSWATANGVPSDAALVLPSALTSPQHHAVPYPYAAPGWLSPPSPVYHSPVYHSPTSHSPQSPAHPYHANGYGTIPPANVAFPPYPYAPAGGAYSPPQPPQPPAYSAQTHAAQTSSRWAEEFPTLGSRSARSSAGSTNGGGAFASKPPSSAVTGGKPSSSSARASSAAADPNFRDALWRTAAAEARESGDPLEIPPASSFDGAGLAGLLEPGIELNDRDVRFFVMKSHGEDDVHRSLRYGWWSSTEAGNARLDAAFRGLDTGEEGESLGDLPKTLDESCGMDNLDRAFIVDAVKDDGDETEDLAPDSSDISRDSEGSDSPSPAGPLEASAADAAADREGPSKDRGETPRKIVLFFSVNCSGHFCGVAEMVEPVERLDPTAPRDAHLRSGGGGGGARRFPTPDGSASSMSPNGFALANGRFRVRWHWVKDVPNTILRHIRLVAGNEKSVTNSRDAQEVEPSQGAMVLSVFRDFAGGSSLLLDDRSRAFYSMGGGYHTSRTAGKARASAMGAGGRKPPLHSYPSAMVPHGAHPNPYNNPYNNPAGFHGIANYGGGFVGYPYAPPPGAYHPYSAHHIGTVAAPFPLGAIATHAAATHGPKPPEFKFGKLAGEKAGVDDEA